MQSQKKCKIVFTYTLLHVRYNHRIRNRNGRNCKKLKTTHGTVSNISFATFSNVSHLLLLAIIMGFFYIATFSKFSTIPTFSKMTD